MEYKKEKHNLNNGLKKEISKLKFNNQKQTSAKRRTSSRKSQGSTKSAKVVENIIKSKLKVGESNLIDLENELKQDLSLVKEVESIVPITIKKILKPIEVPKVSEIEIKKEINLPSDQAIQPVLDGKKEKSQKISIEKATKLEPIKKFKRKKIPNSLIIIIIFIIIASLSFIVYKKYESYSNKQRQKQIVENNNKKILEIKSHYNKYVKTNKEAKIYILVGSQYKEYGKINKSIEIILADVKEDEFKATDDYFKITGLEAYIKYSDVEKIESLSPIDDYYKNYVVFNTNIATNNPTNFYNNQGLVYVINKSFSLPIIIKETDRYYIEYNNQLLYVKKDNVKETISNLNTSQKTRNNIRTITYHSIVTSPNDVCEVKEICHPIAQIDSHIKYINENNYFALTMNDMELFLDKKIQIPNKSILITIDDGYLAQPAIPILEKYKIQATLFLITGSFPPGNYQSKYLELHSHSHNLHTQYVCKGGNQGGGILCLSKEKLLEDLNKSRNALNGSTVFCYPFYDYNDYAISVLKEAGFKMAFIGLAGVGGIATQNVNKFKIPRVTILSSTTMTEFKAILDY